MNDPKMDAPKPTPTHEFHFNEHAPHGPMTYCVCGWRKVHNRAKVRDTAAKRHLAKVAAKNAKAVQR